MFSTAKLPWHLSCFTLAEGTMLLKIPQIVHTVRPHTVKGSLTRDFNMFFTKQYPPGPGDIPIFTKIRGDISFVFITDFVDTCD
jgi:hypothetical protein